MIDAEIHHGLAIPVDLPSFEYPTMIIEGINEMNIGATNGPNVGIIFRTSKDTRKNFLPARVFLHCNKKQLEYILKLTKKSTFTTHEVKLKIERRIKWVYVLRKFWWLLIKFFKFDI